MNDICEAISDLHLISFTYDGYYRVVEPHTYGVDTKGQPALRAYQVQGDGKSGPLSDWRLFRRDKMHGVTVLQKTFAGPRDGYRKGDPFFSTILCEL